MLERMETFRDLLLYCRAGFEGECAQEVSAAAAAAQTQAGDGFVTAHLPTTLGAQARRELADWRRPIFARQCLPVFAKLDALPRADRLTPILAALEKRGERYADACVEAPDSDEGKALAPFCRSFGNALIGALKRADMLDARPPGRSPSAPGRSPSAAEATDGREWPPGSSPSAAEATDGRERPPQAGVVFCADLIPGRPWVHVPVTMGYDRAPELLIDEKRAFLEDKLARDVRLFFTHDPTCALARVTSDDTGRYGTADECPELAGMTV